jgi:predicted DNA-binding ribbon-helix-helix protein
MVNKKRSVVLGGHKTSVSLEEPFWAGLKEIAAERQEFIGELISRIDADRVTDNLSSSIRLFVFEYYRKRALPKP